MRAATMMLGACVAAWAGMAHAQDRVTVTPLPPVTDTPGVAAPQAPAPVVAPITQAIRDRLADRRQPIADSTLEERRAIGTFFDARAGEPLFANATGLTPRGKAIVVELQRADDWGLPASELVPRKLPPDGAQLSTAEIADTEVRLAVAVLRYARFARGGRISDPTAQLATYIDRKPQLLDAKIVLDAVATSPTPETALRGFNPQHPAFEALRVAYNQTRAAKAAGDDVEPFPDGPSLRPGMRHPHVALARATLKLPAPTGEGKAADPALYDPAMVEPVQAFQRANGLEPADGIIGGKTRAAINSLKPPSARQLLVNMEQWRWMPADLGQTYIHVNIPEFTVRMIKDGKVIHTERVVTGLVTNQTPIFSDAMKTVVLQPDWVLPESIKINEALPSLLGGGGMFYSSGLRIKRGETDVDPRSVNWSSANLKAYTFYQPPGDSNALGQVKFLFPNKHAVYMHDTPSKPLFERSERAYSHGCIRVRNPVQLAELVLNHDKGWDGAKVRDLLENGPEDNKIALDKTIPVHVTYFTAVPGDDGKIKTFRDVYGHDTRISLALDGRWGDIDIPSDHLAPVEDREFEFRSAAFERRQYEEERRQAYKGSNGFEKALKSLFGGF